MDYSVGSLADLISGSKAPNKTKKGKSFTPIKKEPGEVAEAASAEPKTPKTPKVKSLKKKKHSSSNVEEKDDSVIEENETRNGTTAKSHKKSKKSLNGTLESSAQESINMDYSVGSLADLISGSKTPNKTKIVKKSFTPIKKEPDEVAEAASVEPKTPKTPKVKSLKKKKHSSLNVEEKDDSVIEENETQNGKTPNKTKIVKKCFTPIKKEPDEVTEAVSAEPKTPKTPKVKSLKKKKHSSLNVEEKDDSVIEENETQNGKTAKSHKKSKKSLNGTLERSAQESKSPKLKKKRKLDESEVNLADSDAEDSPKKQKLSKNDINAANRVRNKINQETKSSSEYNDKTIFVGNIPIDTPKKKIRSHFRKYGLIDSIRIRGIPVADPNTSKKIAAIKKEFHPERNTIYAFIRFENSEDARKAEAENGELFREHHLRVHCCESNEKPDESKAIFVGNIPFNAEDEELWNLFKPCGPISHVRIVRDGRTGMALGFGYVNFKDSDSVQLALEMEKIVLKNRELRISLCEANRAKKKKMGKKPRYRDRGTRSQQQENGDGEAPKEKKFSRNKNYSKRVFAGTKFNDMKKKKKFDRGEMEKKKLARKLVAPKLGQS